MKIFSYLIMQGATFSSSEDEAELPEHKQESKLPNDIKKNPLDTTEEERLKQKAEQNWKSYKQKTITPGGKVLQENLRMAKRIFDEGWPCPKEALVYARYCWKRRIACNKMTWMSILLTYASYQSKNSRCKPTEKHPWFNGLLIEQQTCSQDADFFQPRHGENISGSRSTWLNYGEQSKNAETDNKKIFDEYAASLKQTVDLTATMKQIETMKQQEALPDKVILNVQSNDIMNDIFKIMDDFFNLAGIINSYF